MITKQLILGVERVAERLTETYPRDKCKVEFCSRLCYRMTRWAEIAKDKLAEYETAEEEGRLVVLPCKIGQTVYKIIREPWGFWIGTIPFMFETRRDIGKTVFLTCKEAEKVIEEAEKALKEIKKGEMTYQ